MLFKIFTTEVTDPFLNCATEEWLFRELKTDALTLFLWRNQPCVVIGRGQNPWLECHTKRLMEDQIPLVRRTSGGGTVYHDLGNSNFSFMAGKKYFNKETHIELVINTLKTFNIQASRSSYNDILIHHTDGSIRKISGSAYRETKDRSLHHGTMLIHADLNQLYKYLNPTKKALIAKGVASRRSTVMNLNELNTTLSHDHFCQALIESCTNHLGIESEIIHLRSKDLLKNPSLLKQAELLQDWSWRYGKTLPFKHHFNQQFDWGHVAIELTCEKGLISNCQIQATQHQKVFDQIQTKFIGIRYEVNTLRNQFISSHSEDFIREFLEWVLEEVC